MTRPSGISLVLSEDDLELLYTLSAPASGTLRDQLRAWLLAQDHTPVQFLPVKFAALIFDLIGVELEHGQVRNTALRAALFARRLARAQSGIGQA
jgi:hypothetical protein